MRHGLISKAQFILCLVLASALVAPSLWSSTSHGRLAKEAFPQSPDAVTGQSSTLLPDGRLLLLGGENSNGAVSTAAIRDPRTGVATNLKRGLLHARFGHTATLLPNGMVLIFGGTDVL
jgi:hypothetical protein